MEHDLSLRRAEFENRRTAKLRDNMIVVAGDLSEALGWISSRSVFIRYEDLESALGEMEKKLSQAQSTLGRVSLFFGPQSEAAVSARSAYFFVGQLVARVRQLTDVRPAVDRATHGLNQVITDARDKEDLSRHPQVRGGGRAGRQGGLAAAGRRGPARRAVAPACGGAGPLW